MSDYNGHKSRHHWSVSLNLYNTERLYQIVLQACKDSKSHMEATHRIIGGLGRNAETSEGFKYTVDTVFAAIDDEKLGKAD